MVVACGVAPVLDIVVLTLGLFSLATGQEPLTLLGYDVCDISSFRTEIITHRTGLVGSTPLLKHRHTLHLPYAVLTPACIHLAFIHIEAYFGSIKFQIPIVDLPFAIHICHVATHHNHRIF